MTTGKVTCRWLHFSYVTCSSCTGYKCARWRQRIVPKHSTVSQPREPRQIFSMAKIQNLFSARKGNKFGNTVFSNGVEVVVILG
jgi:hypothetical protein